MTTPEAPPARPRSPGDLFLSFTVLALQGFGGVLAVAQREIVERKRWMSREEFVEEWAVAQIMPGPNVVNLALMIGSRHFGWRGVRAFKQGMTPIVLALLVATGWILATGRRYDPADAALWAVAIASTLIVWRTRLHLLWLLGTGAALGGFGLV
ncbi:MAG: hypothetical protein RIS88_2147 [Pseudomonadota bacterium]